MLSIVLRYDKSMTEKTADMVTETEVDDTASAANDDTASTPNIRRGSLLVGVGCDGVFDDAETCDVCMQDEDEDVETLARREFKKLWPIWSGLTVDWGAQFPAELQDKPAGPWCAIDDLLHLPVWRMYKRMHDEGEHGLFPLMAMRILPNNMSESFCERVFSAGAFAHELLSRTATVPFTSWACAVLYMCAANLIMTDGRTLLTEETLEKLTILRVNRGFMEMMRGRFGRLLAKRTGQQFNMTIPKDAHEEQEAKRSAA